MKNIDLYKIYYYNDNGSIVPARIIAQTDRFLHIQLSNKKRIMIPYNELYNSKLEAYNHILQQAKIEALYKDYVEPTFT